MEIIYCAHCHTPMPSIEKKDFETNKIFCCRGCENVYHLLIENHLDHYYQLKSQSDFFNQASRVNPTQKKYNFLDHLDVRKKFAVNHDLNTLSFFIEGVHCVACIWLLENLKTILPHIKKTTFNFGLSKLEVSIAENTSMCEVARMLDFLGYIPHLIKNDIDLENAQKKENADWLVRIGVAALCAGNNMIFAICLYAGVDGYLEKIFRYVSFFLTLPIIFYAAIPFYDGAISAIRSRKINIDLPVVVAIVIGFVLSVFHLFYYSKQIYFDSISIFVFLLLSTRFFLKRFYQKMETQIRQRNYFLPQTVVISNQSIESVVLIDQLKEGDLILVEAGQMVPADGILVNKEAILNTHLMTGEPFPSQFHQNDFVYAGYMNQSGPIQIQVKAVGVHTHIGKIFKKVENFQKSTLMIFTDQVSKWFLWSVLTLSLGVLFYHLILGHFSLGFQQFLALIMVACPCALALATPLTFSLANQKIYKKGFFIKNPDLLERLIKINEIFFDKTGTLTYGEIKILSWEIMVSNKEIATILWQMEQVSKHPIGRAICQYIETNFHLIKKPLIENVEEELGKGISANDFSGNTYYVGAIKEDIDSDVGLVSYIGFYQNETLIYKIKCGDQILPDAIPVIQELKKMNYSMTLLSGDHPRAVSFVKKELNLDHSFARLLPRDKEKIILNSKHALMVGDGANDMLALKSAYASIAVKGSFEVSLHACDVYSTNRGIYWIPYLLKLAKKTIKLININVFIAILYNIVGIVFVMRGVVTPLFAALLMPISSISVLCVASIGMKESS